MLTRIVIINGPNLNLIGQRETAIYGHRPLADYLAELTRQHPELDSVVLQSNHEGDIIDWLQQYGFQPATGIILNAGGYSHTSIAIADAVRAITCPVVEVHISDIYQREIFRHHTYLEDCCAYRVIGQGLEGYRQAIEWLQTYNTEQ